MKKSTKLILLIILGSITILNSCTKGDKAGPNLSRTISGPSTPFLKGTIRSFIDLGVDGTPVRLGVKFPATAISDASFTQSSKYVIALPVEAVITGVDHIEMAWNLQVEQPMFLFNRPHYDLRYLLIDPQQQKNIPAGFDNSPVAVNDRPEGYENVYPQVIPGCGVRWLDSESISAGSLFINGFNYGYYQGKQTFLEQVILSDLLSNPQDSQVAIKQPATFQKEGYYPTISQITYDETAKEYTVALEGLKHKSPQGN